MLRLLHETKGVAEIMDLLTPKRQVTEDYIQCLRCNQTNSKYRSHCWRCGCEL